MQTRYFALIVGIVVLALGLFGFIPAAVSPPRAGVPDLALDAGYGYLFGIFPVNVLENLIRLVIGGLGIYAYRDALSARRFSKGLTWVYGIFAVMGLFPLLNTMFGLAPLFGNNIWLHAVTAVIAGYYGYARATDPALERQHRSPSSQRPAAGHI